MKRIVLIMLALCMLGYAEDPTVGGDINVTSSYVWRGIEWNDEAVFWPDLWVSFGDFTVTAWASMDLTNVNGDGGMINEFNLNLDYERTIGTWDLSVGYVQYVYPTIVSDATGELYFSFGKSISFFSFSLTTAYDLWLANGLYTVPSVAVDFEAGQFEWGAAIDLGIGGANHNDYYFGEDKGGLTDLTSTAYGTFYFPGDIGEHFSATADIGFAYIPDEALATAVGTKRTPFWAGITLSGWFGGNESVDDEE